MNANCPWTYIWEGLLWEFYGILILQSNRMFFSAQLCKLPPQCWYFDWQFALNKLQPARTTSYPGYQRFLAAPFVTCRPTNEQRRREKTSGEERFDLLFSLNFDHSYRITFKPITANISYCDHMHQHVKIRQI